MNEISAPTIYFDKPGKQNTERTLDLAHQRARELGIQTILVATTSGETGAKAAALINDMQVIAITHSAGFREPNQQELTAENRAAIQRAGGTILTCQHAFGGVNRAVRKQFNTQLTDETIANTFRILGQGMKVAAEMALMAADAGLARTDQPAISIAGTKHGADYAAIVLPVNAHAFFDLKIMEIICRPAPAHPAFQAK